MDTFSCNGNYADEYNTALMQISKPQFYWKRFLTCHAVILLLLASWFFPATRLLWDKIDQATFHWLNSLLKGNWLTQIFWALANVKRCDLFGAIFMASFFYMYVTDVEKDERRTRLAHCLFACIWGELGILFMKEVIYGWLQGIDFIRESPTMLYTNAVMLSESIPWLKVKDFARASFPSDHAEIVLQWNVMIFFFGGKRYGLLALPWSIFFILPRLIGGGHWLSDAVVGSLSLILFIFAWACYSPLYGYMMNWLHRMTRKKAPSVTEATA